MSSTPIDPSLPTFAVPRRGLIAGASALALAGAASLVHPDQASAAPKNGPSATGRVSQNSTPVGATIASPRQSGYVYRTLGEFDFTPEGATSQRAFGGSGVYTLNSASTLWATVDLPAGALVRDVEWYLYNTGPATAAHAYIWSANTGFMAATAATTAVPTGSGVQRLRTEVSSGQYGPFPTGTKLFLGAPSRVDGTLQVNGARVGMTQGGGQIGLLPAPVRAYDSRNSGGKFATEEIRLITLPAAACPAGTVGVLTNVTAVSPVGDGHLRVYPGNAPRPDASSLNYVTGKAIANAITVGVSSSRQIRVFTTRSVHVIVDVTGFIG